METTSTSPAELKSLTGLAKRFVERRMYDEAAQLFEMALRLDPQNMGIQLNLAQVRRLQKQARAPRRGGLEHLRRRALDANHFLGLADLYVDRGEEERAFECLEIAAALSLSDPGPFKLKGSLLIRRHAWAAALEQLNTARRFNPFDREVAQLLGRARYECKDFEGSLTAFVDAFLLEPPAARDTTAALKKRIQDLKHLLGWSNERILDLFHRRQEELTTAFDRLEWHRERFQREEAALSEPLPQQRQSGRIELANRLRHLPLWPHMTDEQIFQLTKVACEDFREPGQLLFSHRSRGADIFVLERGEVTIQRSSSFGTFPLGLIKPGEMFGEMSFITGARRSGTAVASLTSQLLRLDARALRQLILDSASLGVQLYWSFWHALAFKLRCTNEQLKTFFSEDEAAGSLEKLRRRQQAEARWARGDQQIIMQLLQEQGLSGDELVALATFSKERTFSDGEFIVQEGDEGREMYVVLNGRVRISKFIPGAGEEALAILERGGFFGEMSLIDGQPRSADARAHGGPATLIALHQDTIREVLTTDAGAALKFLELLCRLIATRLQELDEKLVSWRILAGQDSEAAGIRD